MLEARVIELGRKVLDGERGDEVVAGGQDTVGLSGEADGEHQAVLDRGGQLDVGAHERVANQHGLATSLLRDAAEEAASRGHHAEVRRQEGEVEAVPGLRA